MSSHNKTINNYSIYWIVEIVLHQNIRKMEDYNKKYNKRLINSIKHLKFSMEKCPLIVRKGVFRSLLIIGQNITLLMLFVVDEYPLSKKVIRADSLLH